MKLKKLVGTILTGALLMTSGITAFAEVPDGCMILKLNGVSKDVAYSMEYMDTEVGSHVQERIDKISKSHVYFKQNGVIRNLKDNKILPDKELSETIYFDVKKVMEVERNADIIMNNEIYSSEFFSDFKDKFIQVLYPSKVYKLGKKLAENGIVGDLVINLPKNNGEAELFDSEELKVVKRSDYPRFMNYYYTDTYEAGNGDKIK